MIFGKLLPKSILDILLVGNLDILSRHGLTGETFSALKLSPILPTLSPVTRTLAFF